MKADDRILELKEAIDPSKMHGYTKDGILQYIGSKKEAMRLMKLDKKKFDPDAKYQLVMGPFHGGKPGKKWPEGYRKK